MSKRRETSEEDFKEIQKILNQTTTISLSNAIKHSYWREEKPKTVDERVKEAETRLHEAKANDAEGDIELKKKISNVIVFILIIQSALIFYIALSQGTKFLVPFNSVSFSIEEWSFRTLIAGTLIETYYLMRIMVTYLFPKRTTK